jgi:hypothetical protein
VSEQRIPLPYALPLPLAFRFKHEIKPPERRYDYYEAHPEHRPRPLMMARQGSPPSHRRKLKQCR